MSDLTIKQEKFCQKYIELGNASEAYRQSYEPKKASDKTIWEEASRLLADPKVSARVEALNKNHLKRHEVTIDRVTQEYARLAFLDIRRAFDEDGNLKPIHDLDDDTAAIAGLDVEELYEGRGVDREQVGRTRKIKLTDKKGALDSLAKHLGMFVERHEHTGKDGGAIEVTAIPIEETARRLASILARAANKPA